MSTCTSEPPWVTSGVYSKPATSILRQLNIRPRALFRGIEPETRTSGSIRTGVYVRSGGSVSIEGNAFSEPFKASLGKLNYAVRIPRPFSTLRLAYNYPTTDPVITVPPWLPEVVRKMTTLLKLPEGWDSYDAARIDRGCVAYALNEILGKCMQATTPIPSVVPLKNGGVMLEWHCRQMDIEVRIEKGEKVHMSFYDDKENREFELDLDGNVLPLMSALAKLTLRS